MADPNVTHVDGDDYTWNTPDVRTCDRKLLDEVAELRTEVSAIATQFASLLAILDIRMAPSTTGLPPPRAAVLVTRRGDVLSSKHCVVYHQRMLSDKDEAVAMLTTGNWAFVAPGIVGAVLDALGVPADAAASA